ncbi:MAG: hypothetical protein OSB47_04850, partial [Pirellulaceae bacterium]|nr:hypothetical protein [Pirellulaceae bacterium]
ILLRSKTRRNWDHNKALRHRLDVASSRGQLQRFPDQNPWECAGSDSGGKACHLPSSADNGVTMELATINEENPCGNRGFYLLCQSLAPGGTKDQEWRRRGSNPRPATFP